MPTTSRGKSGVNVNAGLRGLTITNSEVKTTKQGVTDGYDPLSTMREAGNDRIRLNLW